MPTPDEPDQSHRPDQTHEADVEAEADEPTQESVRRLLAEARHTEPLPPEVAERLDGLLGELVAARSARDGVHSLDARRRRRRGLLLVAAAAAVVIGIGVPTVRGTGGIGGGDDSATDSAGSAGSSAESAQSAQSAQSAPVPPGATIADPVVLTEAGFEDQVRGARLASGLAAPTSPPAGAGAYDSQLTLSFLPEGCGDVSLFGDGELLGASYDGEPAVLAYRPASGADQRVDLLACGTADVIRTTTIPAP